MIEKIAFQKQKEYLSPISFQEKTCKSLAILDCIFIIISLIFFIIGSLPANVILFTGALSIIGLYLMIIGVSLFLLSLIYLMLPKNTLFAL